MTSTQCPCCGGNLAPGQIVVDLRTGHIATAAGEARLMRRTAQIMDALNRARGRSLSVAQIVDQVYGDDPDGGPLTAEGQVKKQIHFARFGHEGYASVRSIGLDIKAARDRGYWLTEVPASPSIAGAV